MLCLSPHSSTAVPSIIQSVLLHTAKQFHQYTHCAPPHCRTIPSTIYSVLLHTVAPSTIHSVLLHAAELLYPIHTSALHIRTVLSINTQYVFLTQKCCSISAHSVLVHIEDLFLPQYLVCFSAQKNCSVHNTLHSVYFCTAELFHSLHI